MRRARGWGGWGTPWTGHQFITGLTFRDKQPVTYCMPLDCGRKPEYPTQGTTCKPATERPCPIWVMNPGPNHCAPLCCLMMKQQTNVYKPKKFIDEVVVSDLPSAPRTHDVHKISAMRAGMKMTAATVLPYFSWKGSMRVTYFFDRIGLTKKSPPRDAQTEPFYPKHSVVQMASFIWGTAHFMTEAKKYFFKPWSLYFSEACQIWHLGLGGRNDKFQAFKLKFPYRSRATTWPASVEEDECRQARRCNKYGNTPIRELHLPHRCKVFNHHMSSGFPFFLDGLWSVSEILWGLSRTTSLMRGYVIP